MRLITAAALVSALAIASTPALARTQYESYVGKDGRTYCRQTRGSATTATIVGGVAGGLLGNVIAGHGNRTAGTLIGAAAGAGAGHAVARRKQHSCG
jgi:uncharacterized protein YcfJ